MYGSREMSETPFTRELLRASGCFVFKSYTITWVTS